MWLLEKGTINVLYQSIGLNLLIFSYCFPEVSVHLFAHTFKALQFERDVASCLEVENGRSDKLVEVDKGNMCGKESLEGKSHLERQRPCTWDLTRPRPGLTISIASATIVIIITIKLYIAESLSIEHHFLTVSNSNVFKYCSSQSTENTTD